MNTEPDNRELEPDVVETGPFDPTAPLTPSGNLRRRQWLTRLAEGGAIAAALLAVGALAMVVYTVVARGGSAISWKFITTNPSPLDPGGGGVAPYLLGTLLIVALATAIAMPMGVLIALYLTEFAGRRSAGLIRTVLTLINGLPSIVIGVFVYGLIVATTHRQSGFAGSIALAIIMVPLIARSSEEMLLLVPKSFREAADALGVSRWRAVLGVTLPAAAGGIVTATVLAVARAAGETAPLILVSSIFSGGVVLNPFGQAVPNVPVSIFQLSEQADPNGYTRAWGEALVLVTLILVASLLARALLTRTRAKLTQ